MDCVSAVSLAGLRQLRFLMTSNKRHRNRSKIVICVESEQMAVVNEAAETLGDSQPIAQRDRRIADRGITRTENLRVDAVIRVQILVHQIDVEAFGGLQRQ